MSDPQIKIRSVPVLIVGGGPVGLAMGLALGRFGVESLVVERSPTTTDHPKSRGCWVRTMEIFRQWSVEDAIRARGLNDGTDIFVYVESLVGREYGRTTPEPRSDVTPAWKSIVAQDAVEEALYAKIQETTPSCCVRFSTDFVGFEEDGDHVLATIRNVDSGESEVWRADWLIAADGAGSRTRGAAGIELDGPPCLAVLMNEYVRADLSAFPVAQEAAGIFFVPSERGKPSLSLLNTNGADRWLMIMRVGDQRDERERPFNDEETQDLLREYTGLPDLPVTRISSSVWRMSRQVAQTFRKGRVLLVGDAAHRFPPTGGFGLNSGVQDAHNLAWKLAYVLNGRASEGLIDSYDLERRPVGISNADFSFGNSLRMPLVEQAARSGNQSRIDFWMDDLENHLHSVGQSIGFAYQEGAIIPDGSTPVPSSTRRYNPSDRPGGRFPHIWTDAAQTESTLDWFDRDFVLVHGDDGADWAAAAGEVSAKIGIRVVVKQLPAGAEAAGCKIGPKGAVLVRPDGHVAWRMGWHSPDPASELTRALQTLLK